jgi:predicted enzyme related to lactoylglutathione lyase
MLKRLALAAGTATILTLTGCARPAAVPPLTPTPTGSYRPGAFVWYDLLAHDRDAVERFYGELFGWTFDHRGEADPDYVTIVNGDRPIGGIALIDRLEGDVSGAQWVSWISVPDVDAAVARAAQAGGTILRDPRDLGARGRVAVIQDAEGALVGFVRAAGGDPAESQPEPGGWLWTELWSHDPDVATAFYAAVVGYERGAVDEPGMPRDYWVFRAAGEPQAGLIVLPERRIRAHWLPYVRVENPQPIVARVEELGGRVLIAPSPDLRNGTVALIADPGGAPLVVQQWPIPGMQRGQ